MTYKEQERWIRRQERRANAVAIALFLLTMAVLFVSVVLMGRL